MQALTDPLAEMWATHAATSTDGHPGPARRAIRTLYGLELGHLERCVTLLEPHCSREPRGLAGELSDAIRERRVRLTSALGGPPASIDHVTASFDLHTRLDHGVARAVLPSRWPAIDGPLAVACLDEQLRVTARLAAAGPATFLENLRACDEDWGRRLDTIRSARPTAVTYVLDPISALWVQRLATGPGARAFLEAQLVARYAAEGREPCRLDPALAAWKGAGDVAVDIEAALGEYCARLVAAQVHASPARFARRWTHMSPDRIECLVDRTLIAWRRSVLAAAAPPEDHRLVTARLAESALAAQLADIAHRLNEGETTP